MCLRRGKREFFTSFLSREDAYRLIMAAWAQCSGYAKLFTGADEERAQSKRRALPARNYCPVPCSCSSRFDLVLTRTAYIESSDIKGLIGVVRSSSPRSRACTVRGSAQSAVSQQRGSLPLLSARELRADAIQWWTAPRLPRPHAGCSSSCSCCADAVMHSLSLTAADWGAALRKSDDSQEGKEGSNGAPGRDGFLQVRPPLA